MISWSPPPGSQACAATPVYVALESEAKYQAAELQPQPPLFTVNEVVYTLLGSIEPGHLM